MKARLSFSDNLQHSRLPVDVSVYKAQKMVLKGMLKNSGTQEKEKKQILQTA